VHALLIVENVHKDAQSAQMAQTEIDRRINDAVAAQVRQQVTLQVDSRITAAVTQAVAETENSAQKRTTALLAAAEKRLDMERWATNEQLLQSRELARIRGNREMVTANYGSTEQ
jgi:hypothetical protein